MLDNQSLQTGGATQGAGTQGTGTQGQQSGGFDSLAGIVPATTTPLTTAIPQEQNVQVVVPEPINFQSFGQELVTGANPVVTIPVADPLAPPVTEQIVQQATQESVQTDTEIQDNENEYIAYEDPMIETVEEKTGVDTVFEQYKTMLIGIEKSIEDIEADVKKMKQILSQMREFDPHNPSKKDKQQKAEILDEDVIETIEGEFDGVAMVGTNKKKYPVPTNYASKSKLVPQDKMKLRIMKDGRMIYKLVEPVERETIKTILSKDEQADKFIAVYENKNAFFVNQAAVSYFKGRVGDEAYIIVNKANPGNYGAIEAIVKK